MLLPFGETKEMLDLEIVDVLFVGLKLRWFAYEEDM